MQNPHRWVFLCSLVSLGVAFFAMFPVLLRPLRDRHRPVLWHELIEMDGATAKFATKGFWTLMLSQSRWAFLHGMLRR